MPRRRLGHPQVSLVLVRKSVPSDYGPPLAVLARESEGPLKRLAQWSLRLQEFDMTVVYKFGRKQSDADCLPRAPVEAGPPCTEDDEYECFIGALDVSDMAALPRDDTELRGLIEHLKGQESALPRVFIRTLPTFSIRQGALYKENFNDNNTAWLLVIHSSLRE